MTATARTKNTPCPGHGQRCWNQTCARATNSAKAQGQGLHSICGDQDLLGKPRKSPVSGLDLSEHHGTSDQLTRHCCYITCICFAYLGDTMLSSLQALPSPPVAGLADLLAVSLANKSGVLGSTASKHAHRHHKAPPRALPSSSGYDTPSRGTSSPCSHLGAWETTGFQDVARRNTPSLL